MKSQFTVKERMNMSLDEIIKKEHYYNNLSKGREPERTPREPSSTSPHNTISYTNIYNWIIHIDIDGLEYVSGYRHNSNNIYETSNIREKIIMNDGLLVITKNDSFYKLPFLYSYY